MEKCNTWDKNLCPSPCDSIKCPAFAKCQDLSNETDPSYQCLCQLGTVKKDDKSSCIAPTPQPVTLRPEPELGPSEKVRFYNIKMMNCLISWAFADSIQTL